MLITEKLEQYNFAASEQILIDYILEKKELIKDKTTKQIAKETFTSASTLVRIAQKIGFSGWNELKDSYLQELEYLNRHFSHIDANIPFSKDDSLVSIANKLAVLNTEAINDTLSLINHSDLKKAIEIIKNSSYINLFAVSNNLLISQEFKYNMAKINKRVEIPNQGDLDFTAYLMDKDSCALVISYSGETKDLIKIIKTLKKRNIKIVAITSIGDNSLSLQADCVLRICTREKLYSKIATFTTTNSIQYILDVLYSCIFSLEYNKNLNLRIETSKYVESGRSSTLDIIKEKDD
ncbi:MAG: MurR/RpiR family transcriptional regulator [Clostridium perfringens]|nr:MurR/RpiR family transcriptional regulator [Clostridium perfringens]